VLVGGWSHILSPSVHQQLSGATSVVGPSLKETDMHVAVMVYCFTAGLPATPNDYVYLGCVADEEDVVYYDEPKPGQPGLPSMLLTVYNEEYLNISACASAAKRVGKRFFGLQRDICRAGAGLINALRHSATPGACSTHCAPDYVCRGGSRDPLSTSLYVFKNGKGEPWFAVA
jgi:hypothetical protein